MAKTIIVTGASKGISDFIIRQPPLSNRLTGIGLAITQYIIGQTQNVVIIARSKELLDKIRDEHPKQVRVLAGDMQDLSIAHESVVLAMKEFGQLDGVIINHPVVRIEHCNPHDWSSLFAVNLFSAVAFVSRECSEDAQLLTIRRRKQRFRNSVNPKGPSYSPRRVSPLELTAHGELMEDPKLL